jgi:hypothetical protein
MTHPGPTHGPRWQQAPPPERRSSRVARVAWTLAPLLSLGVLTFVPFLAVALRRRRKRDWLNFLGYLLTAVLEVVIVEATTHYGPHNQLKQTAGVAVIFLTIAGAVHTYTAMGELQAQQIGPGPALGGAHNQDMVEQARARLEHRRQARRSP